MRKASIFVGLGLGVVACVAGGVVAMRRMPARATHDVATASTAHAVRAVHADGRVVTRPGKQAKLGAELQGRITHVHVVEGQKVTKGELLAELASDEYKAALQEAVGSANEAYARVRGRNTDLRRSKKLVATGALPKQEGDHVREEKTAAEGRLAASNGAAVRARALLAKTRIVAPLDGVVVSRFVDPSETVGPGTPLFVVADLSERRVEAEVDEFDIGNIALGIQATVTADGFPSQHWNGSVEEIPSAVQPRRLRPQDPARPTDSAVLLVKVSLPVETPLKLGQRVNVTFNLEAPPTSSVASLSSP